MAAATLSTPLHDHFSADLRHAESIRKKIVLNYSIIGSVLFIGLIIEAVTWMSIAILVIALFVLVYTRWYGIPVPVFEQAYIDAVSKHIISPYRGLQIDYLSHLKVSELINSGFIKEDPDYFSGRNLIHGEAGDAYIRISEVYLRNKDYQKLQISSTGGQLKALVMVAEINGDATAETTSTGYQISTDDLQALSTRLSNELGNQVHICIQEGRLYAAIVHDTRFAYLEPKLTKTVFFMKPIERYARDVQAMIQLASQTAIRG